ncbi:MAG: hypothetical protein AB7S26_19675 [Sandaracinaceae bacterium]
MQREGDKTMAWLAASILALAAAGCGGDEGSSTSSNTVGTQEPTANHEEPAEPDPPAGPVAEDPSYELRATPGGPYTAGEAATFQIQLTPRGVYHVNQDFPMEIALSGPDGVTLPSAPLGNGDAAEFTEGRARFDVPFTATSAGEKNITAEVDFAVCTPESCFPEHRTLAFAVNVQ